MTVDVKKPNISKGTGAKFGFMKTTKGAANNVNPNPRLACIKAEKNITIAKRKNCKKFKSKIKISFS